MWVDNMENNLTYSYLYTKKDVYYFSKEIPKDIRSHYKRDRIVICLKTKSQFAASRACKSLIQRLEDYRILLRLSTLSIPAKHLLKNKQQMILFQSWCFQERHHSLQRFF